MEMLAHVTEVKLFHHPFYRLKFSPEKDTVRKKKWVGFRKSVFAGSLGRRIGYENTSWGPDTYK